MATNEKEITSPPTAPPNVGQAPPQPARPAIVPAAAEGPPSEVKESIPTAKSPQKDEYGDDVDSPVHYTRDPSKLIAYLVPFPKPDLQKTVADSQEPAEVPERFLIYTPPPPPIPEPAEGEKESRMVKIQRKWQNQIREAKTTDAKVTSWKGAKSRAMKGINKAMNWTTSSSIDFLNRVPAAKAAPSTGKEAGVSADAQEDSDAGDADTTKKTVGLQEMILVYPNSLPGTEEEIRTEFVESMMRSKSKAQRDAVIATGLLPVGLAVDILATIVWPFGGLAEIDAVWGYSSMRGAKTARNVTKRLHSSGPDSEGGDDQHSLHLHFVPSPRIDVLRKYLHEECHKRDARLWKSDGVPPTVTDAINAIGWNPSSADGKQRNWEDEQWELSEVKDDFKSVMSKGAKEWEKWCNAFKKNPEKALKK